MATKRYKRHVEGLEERRRKGMRMLARGVSQADVARELDVSRQTASSWARKLADDPTAWRRRPLGRPSGLSRAQKSALERALSAGPKKAGFPGERWTLALVAQLVEGKYGLSYSTAGIRRILKEAHIPWRRRGVRRTVHWVGRTKVHQESRRSATEGRQ